MATRKKTTSKKKTNSGLISGLFNDERTPKIIGLFFLLSAIFLFVAMVSYMSGNTWQVDQIRGEQEVRNTLGRLGAAVSHLIVFKWFGIAAMLLVPPTFMIGVNLVFRRRVFKIKKYAKHIFFLIFFIATACAFISSMGNSPFPWGGGVGVRLSSFLTGIAGMVGAGILLTFLLIGYLILTFNIEFGFNLAVLSDLREKMALFNYSSGDDEPKVKGRKRRSVKVSNLTASKRKVKSKDLENAEEKAYEKANKVSDISEPAEKPLTVESTFDISLETGVVDVDGKDEDGFETINDKYKTDVTSKPKSKPSNKAAAAEDTSLEITSSEESESFESAIPDIVNEDSDLGNINTLYDPTLDLPNYEHPSVDLLEEYGGSDKVQINEAELNRNKDQIVETLNNYDVQISKIKATVGPTVTLYEIVPAPGMRISKIKNLEDDIALSLAALGIRIIAPIPGKGTVGIEVPNVEKATVAMKTIIGSDAFLKNNKMALPIALGKTITNENMIVDLAKMPHLLMAGATGQGKSVGINCILTSLLYKKHPSQLKLVLVDPKKVELSLYQHVSKHFLAALPGMEDDPIITDTRKVVNTLNSLCIEMDARYDLLKEGKCRNLAEYNEKFVKRRLNPEKGHRFMPFIVVVIDEFADLIMTAGKEVEGPITRLAQLARAIGIHLVIATQRPTVKIITGTIKANFPARIAYKVTSGIDSRTILDYKGAEQLIGRGDMLISLGGEIVRLQCAFVDTHEVESVCEAIGDQVGYPEVYNLPEFVGDEDTGSDAFNMSDRDQFFEEGAKLVVMHQEGSTSMIQRRLKLGYNRAGRIMDQLEAAGIVGPSMGSKKRDVLMNDAELLEFLSTLK